MKKIFGKIPMTWPRVLLFAVLAGAFTALMAVCVPDGNSFHEIAVQPEAWVLFAILIIANCENPLEAAEKTFVFFLVSQPLVYLFQVPFSYMGWGLFRYYPYWFGLTLLTFPGAYIGWFIKKDNVWSGIILSVMLALLAVLGAGYLRDTLQNFPRHLVSAVFCFGQIPLYVAGILKNKKARMAAAAVCLAALAGFGWYSLRQPPMDLRTAVNLDSSRYSVDASWTATVGDESISTADLRELGEGDYVLGLEIFRPEPNTVTLRDGEGNEYLFIVSYVENEGLRMEEPPDYALPESWAYYAVGEDKDADLFLICPTVDVRDEFFMSMGDEETKASFLGALNMERGIYEDSARMFAPYYRQAAMKVYSLSPEERESYLRTAYRDVSAAFSRYLEQDNGGRPIILAGFSQGADMCYRLLAEYFGDEALADRLVAVYAIGWPCTEELTKEYPQIRPAASAEDLGVVVSFDCEAPEVTDSFITPAGTKAFAINPLTWTTDAAPADKSGNRGACFTDYSGRIQKEQAGLCGCYIDPVRGVLKVTDVDPADYPPIVPGLPEGSYHVYDYQFFFRNLQQNVEERAARFMEERALAPAA